MNKTKRLFVSTEMEQAYRSLCHFCSRNRMVVSHEYDDDPRFERTRITIMPKTELTVKMSVMSGHPESTGDLEDYLKQAKIFAGVA